MENKITSYAATLTSKWAAEKDDKLLWLMAHGSTEDRWEAYVAFYRRHAEYLFGICYNLANRYKFGFFDEEDLFELTMTKARERANTFKAEGITDAQVLEDAADAWLGGIATRAVVDLVRRIPKCVVFDPQWLDGEEGKGETTIVSDEPFEGTETEEMKLIREAIDTLSQKEKEVIWAISQFYVRRDHQRTPPEDLDAIVNSLGISRENFRKIKQRAKAKILQFMASRKPVPEAK